MLKLKLGVAAVLAIAITQSATGAAAGTPDPRSSDEVRVVVRYSDLNLATPEGAHALRARADRAAMRVKGYVFPRDLTGVAELSKARAAALAAANAIIAAQAGTAYAARSPAPSELHL
jgi:UrcA family protein